MESKTTTKISYDVMVKGPRADSVTPVSTETINGYDLDMQFINIYIRFLNVMMKFNSIQLVNLLSFCIYVSDKDGYFRYDMLFRKQFEDELKKMGKNTWSISNYPKIFKQLIEHECMIRLSQGVYQLNPEFVLKGHVTRDRRIKNVQVYLKISRSDIYNDKYKAKIDVDYDEIEE